MFVDVYSVLCDVCADNDRNVFIRGDGSVVSLLEFSNEVARYVDFFSKIDGDKIILYIVDDVYLFYVLLKFHFSFQKK